MAWLDVVDTLRLRGGGVCVVDEVPAEGEVELKPYIQYYRDGSRNIYMQGKRQDDDGGFFVHEFLDVPLPGIVNKIKRLLHIGGYERIDVHKKLLERRDQARLIK